MTTMLSSCSRSLLLRSPLSRYHRPPSWTWFRRASRKHFNKPILLAAGSLGIPASLQAFQIPSSSAIVQCQSTELTSKFPIDQSRWNTIIQKARRALRIFARLVKLSIALTPLVLLYPFLALTSRKKEDAHTVVLASDSSAADELSWYTRLYLELCLASVEWSGAAVIKLMQWLSSRPDLVGPEFCAIFSKLQDDTTPHAFRYTNQILTKAYGENWQDHIRLEGLIGSGCIGQVYKGYIQNDDGTEQAVAVKVLHPSIEEDIDVDLDILRGVAKLIPLISRPLSWLNPEGAVEEFGRMLVSQLDLRHEARNLQKFCQNFEGVDYIEFPRLVEEFQPTQHCLVETFLEGLPILEFAKSNRDNPTLLHQLCIHGIAIVCRMIFILNHCHGDLHPGNVMVTPHNKIGLLDFGIVNEYTEEDHDLIVSVLTSFIHHKGRQAARYMMDNSNVRLQGKDAAVDEEGFIEKIDAMAQKAAGKDYLMENLGTYISQICNAAAEHHVLMNQAFVSAALAIKVQEGIVLSLDPSLQIWRVANPIILEGEAIRKAKQLGETMSSKSSWFSRLFHKDASAAVEKN